jgi:2-polyprenyl-3-methyl-5-hydroxy-6-metoxy-1,4-benzoquinol methylase
MEKTTEQIKSTEEETLATFQEEIPSQYFSHLDKVEYDRYSATAEAFYRNLFKFPKEMFAGKELIDFGAGTGENTVYLANWGAKCTLVEMNYMSQDISKKCSRNTVKTLINQISCFHQFLIISPMMESNMTSSTQEAFSLTQLPKKKRFNILHPS